MKTLDNIFTWIDRIFSLLVVALFGAMVLGFASCSNAEDDEDEFVDTDRYTAALYTAAMNHGATDIVFISSTPGTYLADVDEDAGVLLTVENMLIPALRNQSGLGLRLELATLLTDVAAQESYFGSVYFTLLDVEPNTPAFMIARSTSVFRLAYCNYIITLDTTGNQLTYSITKA